MAENRICSGGKMEGLQALCDMLKTNNTLQSIKCACCVVQMCLLLSQKRHHPLTLTLFGLLLQS